MAAPTKQERLSKAGLVAEEKIRLSLPEITDVLINEALGKNEKQFRCQHCKKQNTLKGLPDAKAALALLERILGKVSEKREPDGLDKVVDLLRELNTLRGDAAGPLVALPAPPEEAIEFGPEHIIRD